MNCWMMCLYSIYVWDCYGTPRGTHGAPPVFPDGASVWANKSGQHLLHERHGAVPALCSGAQVCAQKVTGAATDCQCMWKNLVVIASEVRLSISANVFVQGHAEDQTMGRRVPMSPQIFHDVVVDIQLEM